MSCFRRAEVYVVDVCGTLFRDDTTLGLLRHHFGKDKGRAWRRWLFNLASTRRSPFWFAFAVAEKLSGRHLLKHFLLRLLAGDRVAALEDSAREYAGILLSEKRIPAVWELLESAFDMKRVVLASASLEPVISALADSTGVRYVASTLEQYDGVLTGRYKTDLTGQKSQALLCKYGKEILGGQVCVFTDNFTDRALVESAAYSYIILHKSTHRERWKGVDATFLEVNG